MIHESQEDRLSERETQGYIEERWRCQVVHSPTLGAADFLIHRAGVLSAVAEYKRRHNRSNKYQTLTIDCSKIDKLVLLGKMMTVPSLLLIQWDNGMFYHQVESVMQYRRSQQTLNNVRDPGDIGDWVYHIPVNLFSLL